MFLSSMPFEDALLCYELLKTSKSKSEVERSLFQEFLVYARQRAFYKIDPVAKAWLIENGVEENKKPGSDNPLSYFHPEWKELPDDVYDYTYDELVEAKEKRKPLKKLNGKQSKESEQPKLKILTQKQIEKILSPLDKMVGLTEVKREIRRLIAQIQVQARRQRAGLPVVPMTLHMAFTGNPGTGKTTVARLMADILFQIGYLSENKTIETDRSSLVGEYIGETAQKTRLMLDSAKGGVLFIDEAQSLVVQESAIDFGHEAVAKIIKVMEDSRDDLVIIFAGYEKLMQDFLRGNPGLHSRIPYVLHFEDLNAEAMTDIFADVCAKHKYNADPGALEKLKLIFHKMDDEKRRSLGNGRAVRNLFEKAIRLQAERLISENVKDRKGLMRLTASDIPVLETLRDKNVTFLKTE